MRILYAEDHKTTREGATKLLEQLGHEVHAVKDGQKAFDYLKENQVDLLLTDNGMPRMTGLELIREARGIGFRGRIILMSGDSYLKEKVREIGADFFVTKPDCSDLVRILKKLSQGVEA